jgi:hypothetical protein
MNVGRALLPDAFDLFFRRVEEQSQLRRTRVSDPHFKFAYFRCTAASDCFSSVLFAARMIGIAYFGLIS